MFYEKKNVLDEIKKIYDDIKKSNISPYYFIYGIETYFILQIEKYIENSFIDTVGVNTKTYTDENFDYDEAVKYINNMPLMNDKKLIIFKNVKYFKNKKEKLKNKNKSANEFLDAINETKHFNIIVFIFTETDEKYNVTFASNEYLKFVEKNGVVFNSTKLELNSLSKYTINHFKKKGFEISKENALYLIKKVGTDINNIFNEANKIISYKAKDNNEKKVINKNDLDDIVIENHEEKVFQLVDFINKNMLNEAYGVYGELLAKGMNEWTILTIFARNYESLLVVRDLTEKSKSVKEISEILNIPEWRVKNYCNSNKGISKETLKNKLEIVTNIQFNNMIGDYNENEIFELLINGTSKNIGF